MYPPYIVDPAVGPEIDLLPEQLTGNVLILRFGAAPGANATSRPRFDPQSLMGEGSPLQALILVAEGQLEDFWEYGGQLVRNGSVTTPSAAGTAGTGGSAPMVLSLIHI